MFADEVVKRHLPATPDMFGGPLFIAALSEPHVTMIRLQNVVEYYWAGTDAEFGNPGDFPNVAPPWRAMWAEWTQPRWVVTAKLGRVEHPMFGWRFGLLVSAVDRQTDAADEQLRVSLEELVQPPDAVRWLYLARAVAVGNTDRLGLYVTWVVSVRHDGSVENAIAPVLEGLIYPMPVRDSGQVDAYRGLTLEPALLGLCFANCRNVRQDVQHVDPKLQRRRAARGRLPITRTVTLVIDPMREALRREGRVEHVGIRQALHLVRGHFKTYTDQRPLLGRAVGTFWFPQHVRGTAHAGRVDHVVEVHAPQPQEEKP